MGRDIKNQSLAVKQHIIYGECLIGAKRGSVSYNPKKYVFSGN